VRAESACEWAAARLSTLPSGHRVCPGASRVKHRVSFFFPLFATKSCPVTTSDTWAARFKRARKAYNPSQEKFAEDIGAARKTVSRWETGKDKPGPKYRPLLAEINGGFAALIEELPEEPIRASDLAYLREALSEVLDLVQRIFDGLEEAGVLRAPPAKRAAPRRRSG
jgi:transcriptional regulator with XRE-family HTH domain